jgi:hypothetical protein
MVQVVWVVRVQEQVVLQGVLVARVVSVMMAGLLVQTHVPPNETVTPEIMMLVKIMVVLNLVVDLPMVVAVAQAAAMAKALCLLAEALGYWVEACVLTTQNLIRIMATWVVS